MKHLILRTAVLIIAFTFGLTVHAIVGRLNYSAPPSQKINRIVEAPVAPATPAQPPNPSKHTTFDFDEIKFGPIGDYFVIGNTSKDFEDFGSLSLWWWEEADGSLSGAATIQAYAHGNHDNQNATFALVTEQRALIVTESSFEGGFGYRFDGEFLDTYLGDLANTTKPVLRGTLTKTKNGKKVAEQIVSFRLEQHKGC